MNYKQIGGNERRLVFPTHSTTLFLHSLIPYSPPHRLFPFLLLKLFFSNIGLCVIILFHYTISSFVLLFGWCLHSAGIKRNVKIQIKEL